MAFWTNGAAEDPKRNFRFIVTIAGFKTGPDGDGESTVWWAKKVQKPNFTVAESKHVFLGHSYYWPGKVEWQEITMTLVDPVKPGALALLNKIVEQSGYDIPNPAEDLVTQSKSKSQGALGAVQIKQIDAEGKAIETWTLNNPFIKKISFSDLDYENDDLTTIDLSFRYDWATCLTGKAAADAGKPYFDVGGPIPIQN